MNDEERIRQMVEDGQITSEEAEQLIAVLREVDAAGERLAAAGSAGPGGAGAGSAGPGGAGATAAEANQHAATTDQHTESTTFTPTAEEEAVDDDALDAAFDEAFQDEYDSQVGAAQSVHDMRTSAPPETDTSPEGGTRVESGPNHEGGTAPGGTEREPGARQATGADEAGTGAQKTDDRFAQHAAMKAAHDVQEHARERAREAARHAREAAREAARQARDAARDAMRGARDVARDSAREARQAARDTAKVSRDAVREEVASEMKSAAEHVDEAVRPGASIAPAGTRWVTVEMLAGELEVEAVPGLTVPAARGGPGEFHINEVSDGYRIQFLPDRGNFIDRIVTSLKSGNLKVQVPPDFGLNVVATAGEVSIRGVKFLRGRMRAGELTADVLEGVDFGMTAGEFSATLDLRPGSHTVTLGAGDLNVKLPSTADVRVTGRVSIGDLDSRVPGLNRSGSGLGGAVEGTLGTGAAHLDLRVTTGDLDIRGGGGRDG